MKKAKEFAFRSWFVLIFLYTVTAVSAAEFPTRPITLVNPMSPGGSLDLQARAFAALGEKLLGQPVMVTNKPGATGMIALAEVANANPDGHTLFVGATTVFQAVEWEIINGRKPAATGKDLIAVGAFTLSPNIVAVPYNSPWKTLADLIRDCKAKPGHYSFGSGGLYGSSHIPAELLMRSAGIKARHVPYKGGGPALAALVGGHIDFHTPFPPTSIPLFRGNKLRLLAVQSEKRLKSIPEVATLQELGIQNAEHYMWVGIMAPKKTPPDVLKKLRDAAAAAAKDPAFIDAIEKPGDEVRFMSGEELAKFMEHESKVASSLFQELIKEKK